MKLPQLLQQTREEILKQGNRIRFDETTQTVFLATGMADFEYPIKLSQIEDERALLRWLIQLSDKKWIDADYLGQFICLICDIKGWE